MAAGPDELLGKRVLAKVRLARFEARIAQAIDKALAAHKAKALAAARAAAVVASVHPDPFDTASWDTTVDTVVGPEVEAVLTAVANNAADFLNLPAAVRSAILGRINVSAMGQTFTDRIKGIGDAAAGRLNASLAEGVQAGESIPKLEDRVAAIFGQGASSAETIARTEVHGAAEWTTYATAGAVQDSGLVVTKTWLATDDARTRPDHADADGQEVAYDDAFQVGGDDLMFPGDPDGSPEQTVNCRCSVVYTTTDAAGDETTSVGDDGED